MKLDKTNNNRCFIVLYFDKDGLVDRYMIDMLKALRSDAAYILVVVNGFLTDEAAEKMKAVSDEVIFRPNAGFDVGGYREGLFYLGFKELARYDELVLMNYTFFGPLYPFSDMFREMNQRDLDFWGITENHGQSVDPYGKIIYGCLPEHLNSHFLALRRDFFKGFAFRDFMTNMKNPDSYVDSIADYEAVFTRYFADLGFRWEAYVDSSDYAPYSNAPFAYEAAELIEKKKCPILKRRNFFSDYTVDLQNTAGESQLRAYEALLANTDYNPALMWENVLRLQDLGQIRQTMHVSFYPDSEWGNHTFAPGEAAVFVCGPREVFSAVCGVHVSNFPPELSVRFLTDGTYVERLCRAAEEAGDAEIVAFLNPFDLPAPAGEVLKSSESSLRYGDLTALVQTPALIGNILDIFAENEHIGLLVPPLPNYGAWFETIGDGWAGRYEDFMALKKTLGMTFPVLKGPDQPVYPFGGSFWCRTKVLRKAAEALRKAGADDMLARIALPYLAQQALFMTGTVCGSGYAAVLATNYDWQMRTNNRVVFDRFGPDFYYAELDKISGKAP